MTFKFSVVKIKPEGDKCHCMIKNAEDGVPLYYANIYLSILENKGRSFNTILRIAYIIIMFEEFLSVNGIDLTIRLKDKEFLTYTEIYSLSAFLRKRRRHTKVINIDSYIAPNEENQCYRLTAIRNYIAWMYRSFFCKNFLETTELISGFSELIKEHKPMLKFKGYINTRENFKSLDPEQTNELFDLLNVNNIKNPFSKFVRTRNLLMITILNETGMRGGELLNLRLDDFFEDKRYISIVKRDGDINDPRLLQPHVKTFARDIPISSLLVKMISEYIVERSQYKHSKEHDYLFITHKCGPSEGQPLTISGYHKLISVISDSRHLGEAFKSFSGHSLRHTWNHRYNDKYKGITCCFKITELDYNRCAILGWKLDSKSVLTYNKRYLYNKVIEAIDEVDLTKGIKTKKLEVTNEISIEEYRQLLGIKSKRQ